MSSKIRQALLYPAALSIAGISLGTAVEAATITLTANDGFNASSFNSAGNWSDGQAPQAGNDYLVDGVLLRTPPDGNSYTFGGDSLTFGPNGSDIAGSGFGGGVFGYKGTGTSGVITVDNLILNGGLIWHINGTGDLFQLAGNVNVAADSVIYPKQGSINISAPISGAATITNPGSDGLSADRSLILSSSSNTFTGDLVIGAGVPNAANARLELAENANLNFVIGNSGENNSVFGAGVAVFNGVFDFDLSGASSNLGDNWTITSVATQSFGDSFSVSGFSELGDVWTDGTYVFDEATGILTVVPEPGSLSLLGLGAVALIRRRRR